MPANMNPTATPFAPQTGARALQPGPPFPKTLAVSLNYQHQLLLLTNANLNLQVAHAQLYARYHSLPPTVLENEAIEPMDRLAVSMELLPHPSELSLEEGSAGGLTSFGEMVESINVCISDVYGCLFVGTGTSPDPSPDIAGAETALRAADGYIEQAESYLMGLEVAVDHHVQAAATEADGDGGDDPPPPSYEEAMAEQADEEWEGMIAAMLG